MAELTIRIPNRLLVTAAAVLVAISALWGISRLWASGILIPKYQIQMFLPNENGLRAGGLVTLNGMRVGSVSKVVFAKEAKDSNRSIQVTLNIQRSVQDFIRSDSKAVLVRRGLFGEHEVDIQRGFAGAPIEPGGEISVVQAKEASLTDFVDALSKKAGCGSEVKSSADNPMPIAAKTPTPQ
jgi:ABC-type transporter Mla subunit MlaD